MREMNLHQKKKTTKFTCRNPLPPLFNEGIISNLTLKNILALYPPPFPCEEREEHVYREKKDGLGFLEAGARSQVVRGRFLSGPRISPVYDQASSAVPRILSGVGCLLEGGNRPLHPPPILSIRVGGGRVEEVTPTPFQNNPSLSVVNQCQTTAQREIKGDTSIKERKQQEEKKGEEWNKKRRRKNSARGGMEAEKNLVPTGERHPRKRTRRQGRKGDGN
ncbi:hypothetical protein CEXT_615971 [Caerostris extrusa]|uniref:Uncharacterized protein n=1 Tax=Caerostris extrusa TaxID=172846 RepID=A0AAV4SNP8_CAEEX|nr:hypothetical protein CEXT_615971 [Caerostris extrusa]